METLIAGGYIGTIDSMKKCLDCGTDKSRKGNYCKPCGYKHREGSGFKKGHPFYSGGEKGWFKKGQKPWNDGTKGLVVAWNRGIKGTHFSPNTEFKKGQFSNELHPQWRGDEVGYAALHTWVARHKERTGICQGCSKAGRTHFANLDYLYTRDLETWRELCPKCHGNYDSGENRGKATKKFGRLS